MARIVEYCDVLRHKVYLNSTGDQVVSSTPCGKELMVIHESEELDDAIASDELGRPLPTGRLYQILACGHHRYIEAEKWTSRDDNTRHKKLWKKLLPAQKEAVRFIEKTGFNSYLNAEMGTGKTPISLSALRENYELLTPCLIICEAGDIYRWKREAIKWLGIQDHSADFMKILQMTPQVLDKVTIKTALSDITITSWTNLKDEGFLEEIEKRNYKYIIADEAHMFKNATSSRAKAFVKFCQIVEKRLFLSGTWLENNLMEGFVPLNILDPSYFPHRGAIARMCITDGDKLLTLHPWFKTAFFDRTSKYIHRLTKKEAGIKLPKLKSYHQGNLKPIWINPEKYAFNKESIEGYNKTLDELQEELDSVHLNSSQIIGLMSQLRHWTGKMKVLNAVEIIALRLMELNDPTNNKLCIGVHHKSVMLWLQQLLDKMGFQTLTMGDESAQIKDEIEDKWKNDPKSRVLVASILGAGKGRNFQFCQNAINLERQWNKSREIQFEQRFHRIKTDPVTDKIITKFTDKDTVVVDYIMAKNSFDEYFDSLVSLKGNIVDSADSDLEYEVLPDSNFIVELAREVVKHRVKHIGV